MVMQLLNQELATRPWRKGRVQVPVTRTPEAAFTVIPDEGIHRIEFQGIQLVIEVLEPDTDKERYQIWGPKAYPELYVNDCLKKKSTFGLYVPTTKGSRTKGGPQWSLHGDKTLRSLDTVALPDGIRDRIENALKQWQSPESKETSARLGEPHQLSMLLVGPPGCGKNSLANAIASKLRFDMYSLSLADQELADGEVAPLLSNMKTPCILLLDEIDQAAERWKQPLPSPFGAPQGVSQSTVLQFLDGPQSVDNVLVIAIANDVSKLPEALKRKGRVHETIELGKISESMVRSAFINIMEAMYLKGKSCYDLDDLPVLADQFAVSMDVTGHSMASIWDFIKKAEDPRTAVHKAQHLSSGRATLKVPPSHSQGERASVA
ncbi:MAG: hypothetical protein Q9188_001290 [Gyalolechia gomerana]